MALKTPRTHCRRGHELQGHNLFERTARRLKNGVYVDSHERLCRRCRNEYQTGAKRVKRRAELQARPVSTTCKRGHNIVENRVANKRRRWDGRYQRYRYVMEVHCRACKNMATSKRYYANKNRQVEKDATV